MSQRKRGQTPFSPARHLLVARHSPQGKQRSVPFFRVRFFRLPIFRTAWMISLAALVLRAQSVPPNPTTAPLQSFIDHNSTVTFPPGRYTTGTLTLHSNLTLRLEAGAILQGSPHISDYPTKHLLQAGHAQNITIEGPGEIDGQGDLFLDNDLKPLPRPSPLIEFTDSQNINIHDLTIRKSPAWTIHTKNCDGVKIRGISLLNNTRAVNTDGIDIDSSRNVIVSDSQIQAGDDCIVLKTTGPGAAPTENVVVSNLVLVSAASALKLGTESFGDFRHILFSNVVIRDSRTGIALLAKDGGSMEDVRFQNISMTTAPKWGQGVEWPIVIDVDKRTAESRLSHIRDVGLSDITIYGKGRVLAEGAPGSIIEGLTLRNLSIHLTGYENIAKVKKMSGGSKTNSGDMPDYGATPAALILAHIRNLDLTGITVTWPDASNAPSRAAVFLDHIHQAQLTAVNPNAHAIEIQNSQEVHQ